MVNINDKNSLNYFQELKDAPELQEFIESLEGSDLDAADVNKDGIVDTFELIEYFGEENPASSDEDTSEIATYSSELQSLMDFLAEMDLKAADENGDGIVDGYEFEQMVLQELATMLGIADPSHVETLLQTMGMSSLQLLTAIQEGKVTIEEISAAVGNGSALRELGDSLRSFQTEEE